MTESPVIVIGAGIGGLSAAIHLATRRRRVTVLEQNPEVGGKMGQWAAQGFRWDTGPSVITMRHVLEDLFHAAGRRLEDYLELVPVEPLTRYFYPDGVQIDATRDLARMTEQIARLHEKDVEGYLRFLAYAARLHRLTGPVFIYSRPPTWRSVFQVSPFDALHIDGLRSLDRAARSFVKDSHLRQMLGRFATYVGANPFRAPATLNVIAHVELTGGVWYPHGGIYQIARALEKLARELGVEILTSAPVQQIQVQNGRVQGVTLRSGENIRAAALIANVDVTTVYEKLLPAESVNPRYVENLLTRTPSCSGFILLLGIEGTHRELAHHNIYFSSDYPREFREIFDQGIPPTEPTIYVSITSKSDPTHAPAGSENWFVLVNAPALDSRWDWSKNATSYRNRVLERLVTMGMDVHSKIKVERIITPVDLEKMTGARHGALYGTSSNSRWSAFRRPHNRAHDIQGLYFAGGTTHPGGGVPMVALSGKVAATLLLDDSRQ